MSITKCSVPLRINCSTTLDITNYMVCNPNKKGLNVSNFAFVAGFVSNHVFRFDSILYLFYHLQVLLVRNDILC